MSTPSHAPIKVSGGFHFDYVCLTRLLGGHLVAIMDVVKDITEPSGKTWIITRINTPASHRGQGHGRDLLTEFLRLADISEQTVTLGVSSSNPAMPNGQLRSWYGRYGFTREKGKPRNALIRYPQPITNQ